jgi:hypothetical protein
VGLPRGTPENRPMRDTSKLANGCRAGQGLFYLAGSVPGKSFSTFGHQEESNRGLVWEEKTGLSRLD